MNPHLNLASLPHDEALQCARAAGRAIFRDSDAIAEVQQELVVNWVAKHIPQACGQTEEEFGELASQVFDQFEAGVEEAIKEARHANEEVLATAPRLFETERQMAVRWWAILNEMRCRGELPDWVKAMDGCVGSGAEIDAYDSATSATDFAIAPRSTVPAVITAADIEIDRHDRQIAAQAATARGRRSRALESTKTAEAAI